jgi:ADP-ribose pyrophosphatase YjhB (NUDIX family)
MPKITKEMQLKELNSRIPPILNVDIVLYKKQKSPGDFDKDTFLVGHVNPKEYKKWRFEPGTEPEWKFPGGRVSFEETPQEAARRILKNEVPGVKAVLKKTISVVAYHGRDGRANGVTIFFLFEFSSGEPKKNESFDSFSYLSINEIESLKNFYHTGGEVLSEIDATIVLMNTSRDELLVEVDKDGKEIGSIISREAHNTNRRYHNAAHLLIFNSKGEIVLQRRAMSKDSGAGKWDIHGGHQALGQTIEQTAKQELAEEVGIETELKFFKRWLNKTERQGEFCYVYYGISDGPYGFDRNEVMAIKSFDCEKLLQHKYDKEFEFLPHVYRYVEESRHIWQKLVK